MGLLLDCGGGNTHESCWLSLGATHTKLGLDPGAAILTPAGFTGAGKQAGSFQSTFTCIHTLHLPVG